MWCISHTSPYELDGTKDTITWSRISPLSAPELLYRAFQTAHNPGFLSFSALHLTPVEDCNLEAR